jgi:hypothetical protein
MPGNDKMFSPPNLKQEGAASPDDDATIVDPQSPLAHKSTQQAMPTAGPAMPSRDPVAYGLRNPINIFANDGPVKTIEEAKERFDFHRVRAALMHEHRKSINKKILPSYIMQTQNLVQSIADVIAFQIGLVQATRLMNQYDSTTDHNVAQELMQYIEQYLSPKLKFVGHTNRLRASILSMVAKVHDPSLSAGLFNNVAITLMAMFTGLKQWCMRLDMHRSMEPDLYPAELHGLVFEHKLGITRTEMWTWLGPPPDDNLMGVYDFWFTG